LDFSSQRLFHRLDLFDLIDLFDLFFRRTLPNRRYGFGFGARATPV
jgi:hypothetical protein